MATRVHHPTVRRPSLPLTAADERDLALLRDSPAHRRALADVSQDPTIAAGDLTESALLHAVLEIGLAKINETAAEEGYAQLAEQRGLTPRAAHRRRRPSWADEA